MSGGIDEWDEYEVLSEPDEPEDPRKHNSQNPQLELDAFVDNLFYRIAFVKGFAAEEENRKEAEAMIENYTERTVFHKREWEEQELEKRLEKQLSEHGNLNCSATWYLAEERAFTFAQFTADDIVSGKPNETLKEMNLLARVLKKPEFKEELSTRAINLIDLGCGNGLKSSLMMLCLDDKDVFYFPFDVSRYMLAIAKTNVARDRHVFSIGGKRYRDDESTIDSEVVPFTDVSEITTELVQELLENKLAALKEIRKKGEEFLSSDVYMTHRDNFEKAKCFGRGYDLLLRKCSEDSVGKEAQLAEIIENLASGKTSRKEVFNLYKTNFDDPFDRIGIHRSKAGECRDDFYVRSVLEDFERLPGVLERGKVEDISAMWGLLSFWEDLLNLKRDERVPIILTADKDILLKTKDELSIYENRGYKIVEPGHILVLEGCDYEIDFFDKNLGKAFDAMEYISSNENNQNIYTLLGQTLGNFTTEDRNQLLKKFYDAMNEGDMFIVGVELRPQTEEGIEEITGYYNEGSAVEELMRHSTRVIGIDDFVDYDARYENNAIEMFFTAKQGFEVDGRRFEKGDEISVGTSYKFNSEELMSEMKKAGFSIVGYDVENKLHRGADRKIVELGDEYAVIVARKEAA